MFDNILQRIFPLPQIITFENPKSVSSTFFLFLQPKFLPYNKQFGVKTSDISSSYTKHNGRLFKTPSTSNKTVSNSVNDNFSFRIDFFKQPRYSLFNTKRRKHLPVIRHNVLWTTSSCYKLFDTINIVFTSTVKQINYNCS